MSQLDIKIRKLQDNGSTFRANIETLYLGGVRSAKVDRLHFEVPEEADLEGIPRKKAVTSGLK